MSNVRYTPPIFFATGQVAEYFMGTPPFAICAALAMTLVMMFAVTSIAKAALPSTLEDLGER